MSWLREHFGRFVYPALAETRGKEITHEGLQVALQFREYPVPSRVPFRYPNGELAKLPAEVERLHGLCLEYGIPFYPDFRLARIQAPSFYGEKYHWGHSIRGNLHFDILRSTLLSAEARRKSMGKRRLLFTGRDVWALEVMARKRNLPTCHIPELSRIVCRDGDPYRFQDYTSEAVGKLIKKYELSNDDLFVDTGFVGSIVKAINRYGLDIDHILMSQDPQATPNRMRDADANERKRIFPNQLFPQRRAARTEALDTEYLPKYFKTGTYQDGAVVQWLNTPAYIVRTALLTSLLWRGLKVMTDVSFEIARANDQLPERRPNMVPIPMMS